MGNRIQQSDMTNNEEQFANTKFELIEEGSSTYFGNYQIIKVLCRHQVYMKRQLFFPDHQSLKQFVAEAQNIQQTPFNVISPKKIFQGYKKAKNNSQSSINFCSFSSSIVIFHIHYKSTMNLFQKVQSLTKKEHQVKINDFNNLSGLRYSSKEAQLLSQTKLWFLLNQLSRSIEILAQRRHCHWNILPQTIYYDSNQNWFIHDSYFIMGPSTQDFLQRKNRQKEFMSQQLKKKIQFGISPSSIDGIEEDIYCLGHCLIFAITGVHPKDISKSTDMSYERQFKALKLLQKKKYSYSKELLDLIKKMIFSDPKKRLSIRQLRFILKQKQISIIQDQEKDFIEMQTKNSILNQKQKSKIVKEASMFRKNRIDKYPQTKYKYKSPEEIRHYKEHHKTQYESKDYNSQTFNNLSQISCENLKTVKKYTSPRHFGNYNPSQSQYYGFQTQEQINKNPSKKNNVFERSLSPKYNRDAPINNVFTNLNISIVTQTPIKKMFLEDSHQTGFNSPSKLSANNFKISYFSPQKKYI